VAKRPLPDLSALDKFSEFQLNMSGQSGQTVATGLPLELSLDEIKEDPGQPRTVFDPDSLKELAASIEFLGVLEPISVRKNPEGGYIINSGARRFRAAGLAGLKTIRAFIHEPAHETVKYTQMAENIHRDNLKPLEIAAFISGEIANGKKQADIARMLGKSRAYVNQYVKLSNGPDWIKQLSATGVCSDATTLVELISLADAGTIENMKEIVQGMSTLSRADVKKLSKPDSPAESMKLEEVPESGSRQPHGRQVEAADSGVSIPSRLQPPTDSIPADGNREASQTENQAEVFLKGEASDHEGSSGEKPAKKKEKEPNLEVVVYISGRKGYLQTSSVEIWWDDIGSFEKIPLKNLPREVLDD
jgi:ParB family chromosome partitioning protein